MTRIMNPYGVTIQDVVLRKFNPNNPFGNLDSNEPLSIMPQVSEFTLHQSVFSPVLKAQIAVYDAINLLTNYPMMGEETIEVILEQKGTQYVSEQMTVSLKFIVSGITGISYGKTARDMTYIIDLTSYEAYENAKKRVSKAYKSGLIQQHINNILIDYLNTQKPVHYVLSSESSDSVDRVLVVPNLKPFSAITWLTKMAVPANPDEYHNYVFYETVYGSGSRFTYKPFQYSVWQDSVGEAAFRGAENRPFYYLSNYEQMLDSPEALQALSSLGVAEERLVISMTFNKRYSVLEKIIGGYFENEYVEINMDQKVHNITKTTVKDPWKQMYYGNYLQSNNYIDNIISADESTESSARVKYAIFNFDETQDPKYRYRLGKQEISKIATSQVDMTVDIPVNLKIVAGDLFYLNIPTVHGYNEVEQDRYLQGHFYITENKMVIRSTGEAVMQLRLNKDSYFVPIDLTKRIATEKEG